MLAISEVDVCGPCWTDLAPFHSVVAHAHRIPQLSNGHVVPVGSAEVLWFWWSFWWSLMGCYRSFLDATGQVDRASIQAVFSKTWVLHLWESNSTYFNIIIFLKWKAVETSWNILEHLETSWNHFNLQISSVCLRGHGFSVLPSLWIILLEGSKCTLQQGRGLVKVLLVHLHNAQVPKILWGTAYALHSAFSCHSYVIVLA